MQIANRPFGLPAHRRHPPRRLQRLLERLADAWRTLRERSRGDALAQLDRRTLADLALDRSEASSVRAEAHAEADVTRRRVVLQVHHHAWR